MFWNLGQLFENIKIHQILEQQFLKMYQILRFFKFRKQFHLENWDLNSRVNGFNIKTLEGIFDKIRLGKH